MEDLLPNALETALETAAAETLGPVMTSANPLVFIAITSLGLAMALVYVPIRLYLTITARSRRLRLLQKIRKLRDELSS